MACATCLHHSHLAAKIAANPSYLTPVLYNADSTLTHKDKPAYIGLLIEI